DPYDVVSGTAPVLRETENIYVRLSDFDSMLRQWMKTGIAQEPVRKFVDGWLESGLEDWCISRDAPYFGFAIPDEPGKYFYVRSDPYDVVSGTAPVLRETENIYVRLSDFDSMLRQWMKTGIAQEPVRKFVDGWLESGLEDWCISRDAPYFGFAIPDEPGKYFYV